MQNKKIAKALTVGLCAVVLAPSLVSAKEFKDVTKNGPYKWAYEYIDELSDKGIINGYPSGDFKPDNAVSFEETVELIKGLLNPSSSQISDARAKYKTAIDDAKVPDWAKDAFAVAIENNVFTEATLKEAAEKGFIGESKDKRVPDRNTIAVYFARALKLSSTGDESYLRHEDKSSIPSTTRGYLANLVKEGIFSSTGSDGKFEGTRSIRRSEMAKITKLSYDYSKKQKTETSTLTGKIVVATNISGEDTILVDQGNKSTIQLKVNSSTKITSNGSTLKFSDLKPEQEVKITYQKSNDSTKNNYATTIEVTNSSKTLVGYVTNRAQDGFTAKYRTDDGKVDTTTTSLISTTDNATFTMEDKAKIYKLGKEVQPSQLELDDLVEFKTNTAGKVTEATVYPKNGSVSGEINSISNSTSNTTEYIKVKLADGKIYTFYGNKVGNNPFNYTSLFNNLKTGQNIQLTTNYKVVTRVGDAINGSVVNGTVNYARYSNTNSYNNNNYIDFDVRTSSETLALYTDGNTEFRRDGMRVTQISPDDLRDKEVRVTRNGNYAQTVEILTRGTNFTVEVRVEDVRNSYPFQQLSTVYNVRVVKSVYGSLREGDTFDIEVSGNADRQYDRGAILEVVGSAGSGKDMNISSLRFIDNGRYYNSYSRYNGTRTN